MTDNKKTGKPLTSLIKNHIFAQGTPAMQVIKEIRELTDKDKADFRKWFQEAGFEVI